MGRAPGHEKAEVARPLGDSLSPSRAPEGLGTDLNSRRHGICVFRIVFPEWPLRAARPVPSAPFQRCWHFPSDYILHPVLLSGLQSVEKMTGHPREQLCGGRRRFVARVAADPVPCCVPTDSRPTGAMRATCPAFGDVGWSAQPLSVVCLVRPEGELSGDATWPVMAGSSSALHKVITVAEPVTHQGWQRVVFEFYRLVLGGLLV